MGKHSGMPRMTLPAQLISRAVSGRLTPRRYGVDLPRMRPVTAAVGSACGVALSVAGLAASPGWLLVAAVAVVVLPAAVLLGLVLLADGPLGRFERILAALQGTTPPAAGLNRADPDRNRT
jgi:hypothetical protein